MDCSAADFVSFQTSDDGLCHTCNAKTNRIRNGSVFSVTENGEDGVLILQLYAHGDEYNRRSLRGRAFFCVRRKGIDPLLHYVGIGFKVLIHDNREMPVIANTATFIGGGRIYRLGYTKLFVESSGVPLPSNWSTIWPAEVQRSFLELHVRCESLLVEHYDQTPSISPVSLLSNIGGQTGLSIGISFLSLMELVEMTYRFIRHQYHVLRLKIQRRGRVSNRGEIRPAEWIARRQFLSFISIERED